MLPEAERTIGTCSVFPVGVGIGGIGPPLPSSPTLLDVDLDHHGPSLITPTLPEPFAPERALSFPRILTPTPRSIVRSALRRDRCFTQSRA